MVRLLNILSWLYEKRMVRSLASRLPERVRARLSAATYDMYEDTSEQFYARIYLTHIIEGIRLAQISHKPRILDVGCGHGRIAIPLAKLGFEVVGIDRNEIALRSAQQHALEENVAVDFRRQDIFSGLSQLGNFDVMIAIETFPGRPYETTRIIDEAYKLLRDGGILAISVRTRYYETAHHIKNADYQRALTAAAGSGNEKWLEPRELRSLLQIKGYTPYKVVGIGVVSGLLNDPFRALSTPGELPPHQREVLEKIELTLGVIEEVSGCGRYMLAIARKNSAINF